MTYSYNAEAGSKGGRDSSLAFFFVPLNLGLDTLDSAIQGGSSLPSYIFPEILFQIPSEMSPR